MEPKHETVHAQPDEPQTAAVSDEVSQDAVEASGQLSGAQGGADATEPTDDGGEDAGTTALPEADTADSADSTAPDTDRRAEESAEVSGATAQTGEVPD